MNVQLQKEIEKLKRQILGLSAKVENDVRMAVRAADNQDRETARRVVSREKETNVMEVNVEEECLKILALHQPVASDLRYIVAVLKINQDLERIGDLAVHIAERALALCREPRVAIPVRLEQMADKTELLLKKVLDAFVNLDESAAREVCAADHEIDDMNQEIFQQVKKVIMQNPGRFEAMLQIMHIARHLERIGDHATNIAEDLIYLIEGRIVRHTPEVFPKNH
ncbi:MAG: phosphate signaling complex protein PhoU [Kiritimatiellae bacterium]|jgi:phosphate transport system protein|nr:phosphate signaling complex protein PhoU [Kiritimatiellia bacterium]